MKINLRFWEKESCFTPEQRLIIYQNALKTLLKQWQEDKYTTGLCQHLRMATTGMPLRNGKLYMSYEELYEELPEFRRQKPWFVDKDKFWWPVTQISERLIAIYNCIHRVRGKITYHE